jgi:hypothetical protein
MQTDSGAVQADQCGLWRAGGAYAGDVDYTCYHDTAGSHELCMPETYLYTSTAADT